MSDLKFDENYINEVVKFNSECAAELEDIFTEYQKILDEVIRSAIKEGKTANSLKLYKSCTRKMNGQIDSLTRFINIFIQAYKMQMKCCDNCNFYTKRVTKYIWGDDMAEIKVNINGIDEALDTLKKLETLCSGASMKKIPHGDVSGQVINQLTDISNIYLDMYSTMAKIIDSTIAVMSKTGETFEETDKQISMAIKSI